MTRLDRQKNRNLELFLNYFSFWQKFFVTEVGFFWARNKIYTGVCREPDGGKLSSAVNGPDICRQQARQTKFPKVARRLPSTGQTDKIPKGSSTSAVDGPDVCRQRARHLPSTGQTDKISKGSPTSAVNGPDVCRQRARQTKFSKVARRLPSTDPMSAVDGPDKHTQAMSAVNGPDICLQRARRLPSTGPTNKLKQYLLLTGQMSAVNLSKG
jgi:hypothetical protein